MARFLVVDDDSASVDAFGRLLAGDGHDVVPLCSGEEAVDALGRTDFDAVITDLEMPGADGHAVVRAARARSPGACVVVATARSARGRDESLRDSGACLIAEKPVDYDSIVGAIEECRRHGGPGPGRHCGARVTLTPHLTKLRRG